MELVEIIKKSEEEFKKKLIESAVAEGYKISVEWTPNLAKPGQKFSHDLIINVDGKEKPYIYEIEHLQLTDPTRENTRREMREQIIKRIKNDG